ncbi:hypothetical protein BDF14DRAFT_1776503, partial [Spinellus fusiger]
MHGVNEFSFHSTMSKRRLDQGDLVNVLRQKSKLDKSLQDYYAKKTLHLLMNAQKKQPPTSNEYHVICDDNDNAASYSVASENSCFHCKNNTISQQCGFCERSICSNCIQVCHKCNQGYCTYCSMTDHSSTYDMILCLHCYNS